MGNDTTMKHETKNGYRSSVRACTGGNNHEWMGMYLGQQEKHGYMGVDE
jgi:hypothetical protein